MAQQGRKRTDHTLVLALACGSTVENAARQAEVCEATVYRRLQDPAFQAKIDVVRNELFARARHMLTAGSVEAVKTLVDLQGKNQPASVRHSAARTLLEFGVKFRESAELFERVAAIEAQLTGAA
jgi:hypothetical protein